MPVVQSRRPAAVSRTRTGSAAGGARRGRDSRAASLSRARSRIDRPVAARALATIAAALVLWAAPIQAQVVDTTLWVTDGGINAIARDGNTIYIGGYFSAVGPATGGGVPLGVADGAPGPPFPKVLGKVLAAAPDGTGGWYIGGEFTAVGGLERSNLAHILADGSVAGWTPNPNGAIHALAVDGNKVYVGGEFSWIGWRWRDRIAAVDATSGTATPWNPDADAVVRALAVGGGKVYAGGEFSSIGGQMRSRIAALDAASGAATA